MRRAARVRLSMELFRTLCRIPDGVHLDEITQNRLLGDVELLLSGPSLPEVRELEEPRFLILDALKVRWDQ